MLVSPCCSCSDTALYLLPRDTAQQAFYDEIYVGADIQAQEEHQYQSRLNQHDHDHRNNRDVPQEGCWSQIAKAQPSRLGIAP
jgi:hypothetical protein